MKPHILIVEDEAILYDGLSQALKKRRYKVSGYIKSYDKAIAYLADNRPDIALLDIDLEGEKDGLDLGEVLNKEYKIPFIYVTKYDDEHIFQKGLRTSHEHYIVKTKPALNIDEVVRAIETVLHRIKIKENNPKEYILGLTAPLNKIKNRGTNNIHRKAVKYSDVVFFCSGKNNLSEPVPANYSWFLTVDKKVYYLKLSLKDIEKEAPSYFARIKDNMLVNIHPDVLEGRRNGHYLIAAGQEFQISRRFQNTLEEKINMLYTQSNK